MGYEICGLSPRKVRVIRSGQISPEIALHLTKVVHSQTVPIAVADTAVDVLEQGRAKLMNEIAKGVETGAFSRIR